MRPRALEIDCKPGLQMARKPRFPGGSPWVYRDHGGAMGGARYAPEQRSSASPGRDLILGPANAGYHLLRCGGGPELAAPLPACKCGFSADANDRSIFWDVSIPFGGTPPLTPCCSGPDALHR